MIAGQSPRIQWNDNPGGEVRTTEQAIVIAQQNGVEIPDDAAFFIGESDTLITFGPERTACGPRVDKPEGAIVSWSDLVHDKTGRVPFRIWDGILKSDEAIVAVFAHELYELAELRPLLLQGNVTIEQFIDHTRPGLSGNLHDKAWDFADSLVERMRGGEKA